MRMWKKGEKKAERMDKFAKKEYTVIRRMRRYPLQPELYSKMAPFLGDEQKLIQRMAGRMDVWEECVLLFPREEIIEEMDAALQNGDDTALYGAVHRLKGNLANFGFDRGAEKAAAVLRAIKEKNREETEGRYKELRDEYEQMLERIGEAL